MKKWHILGIVVIGVAIMILISTAGDASSYVTFKEASAIAENGNNNKIHVVGELKKDQKGNIIGINPSADKLSFSFIMIDQEHQEQLVYYKEPMPPDFLRSEQVVVIGGYQEDFFVAEKILLKCPSKYVDDQVEAKLTL